MGVPENGSTASSVLREREGALDGEVVQSLLHRLLGVFGSRLATKQARHLRAKSDVVEVHFFAEGLCGNKGEGLLDPFERGEGDAQPAEFLFGDSEVLKFADCSLVSEQSDEMFFPACSEEVAVYPYHVTAQYGGRNSLHQTTVGKEREAFLGIVIAREGTEPDSVALNRFATGQEPVHFLSDTFPFNGQVVSDISAEEDSIYALSNTFLKKGVRRSLLAEPVALMFESGVPVK